MKTEFTFDADAVFKLQAAIGMLVKNAEFTFDEVMEEAKGTSVLLPQAMTRAFDIVGLNPQGFDMEMEDFRVLLHLVERLLAWRAASEAFSVEVFKKPLDIRSGEVPDFAFKVMDKVYPGGGLEPGWVKATFEGLYAGWQQFEFMEKGGKFDA